MQTTPKRDTPSKGLIRIAIASTPFVGIIFSFDSAFASRKKTLPDSGIDTVDNTPVIQVPAVGTLEAAFSPGEGSEALVVNVIDSARHDIPLLAYSITSAPVVDALLHARKRSVDVKIVVDKKSNVSEDKSRKAWASLSALSSAGVDVRTISVYPIHHDKVNIVHMDSVELGSFNYSKAAAHENSENALVNWHNPQLAGVYVGHFEQNYRQSAQFQQNH